MEKEKIKLLQEVEKGKGVIETSKHEGTQGKGKRKRPRTRGLKKALQEEEEYILLNEKLDLEDIINIEVNKTRNTS